MLCKWKFILTNWNNCYFNDTKTEECITINTLLTIISHLHKNLNLDESKSSILEAQNVEQFILEKYPEFKFEDGTVEPTNEEEVYMVASLLLFFVCVNSKEVDIKQAMCSKLSPEDQETIMKFSKCLMEFSPVTYTNVQAAIVEACGQDIAAGEKIPSVGVAQTPPALRSLHGDVRRLQAALDAERFDRNYLQEELARTNARMEKLQKDKEQYKLEILNLKAKISLSGLDSDERESSAASEGSARLHRQLQDLEERLIITQEQLEDAQMDRDSFKAKIDELKQDRDRWVSVSQQESSRAAQLAEDLETERRRVSSLQELVTELRQHHQKNCLDSSQLECDYPDASFHSLNNSSFCSEACANVVEVQLGEERAKTVALNQLIQTLEEQVRDLNQKAETEKASFEEIINMKDNDICNLKHRINEEIEEKNKLKTHYCDEITKLNNDVNELEQKIKEDAEVSRAAIEQKIQEIQTLQEEKLTLLQTLSGETTKLENIIKNLKTDLDTEKNLKHKMKEDYENQFMKLNEKVLNRNNELVELQNKLSENSELIEQLNLDLKKEKDLHMALANQYNHDTTTLKNEIAVIEINLKHKTDEAKELQKRLTQNVTIFDEFNREIDELKAINANLIENQRFLEDAKESLIVEIQNRDSDLLGIRKEIENITNIFGEEKKRLTTKLEEKNAVISALQTRLNDQTNYKTVLEDELKQLHQAKEALSNDIAQLYKEFSSLKLEVQEKDRMMYALDLYLKEEKHTNKTLKAGIEKVYEEVSKLTEDVLTEREVCSSEDKLESIVECFKLKLLKSQEVLEETCTCLQNETEEKNVIQAKFETLVVDMDNLNKDYMDRCEALAKLKDEYDKLSLSTAENISVIETLGDQLETETHKYSELEKVFDTQTSNLMIKLNEAEKTIKEISSKSKKLIDDKELKIQTLKIEIENLHKQMENNSKKIESLEVEKEALAAKLSEEASYKNYIEEEYRNQCAMVDNVTIQLNNVIVQKSEEINTLKKITNDMSFEIALKADEIKTLQNTITQLNSDIVTKSEEITTMKNTIEQLQNEVLLKSDELATSKNTIVVLNNDIATKTEEVTTLNSNISELIDEIELKCKEIDSLYNIITEQQNNIALQSEDINAKQEAMEELNKELSSLKENITQLNIEMSSKSEEISALKSATTTLDKDVVSSAKEIVSLRDTIATLNSEISEKSEEITYLQNTITRLNNDILRKSKETSSLENKTTQLNQDILMKSDEIERLKMKMNELHNEVVLKNDEVISLEKEIAIKTDEITSLKTSNNHLNTDISSKHEKIELLEKEIATISRQADQKTEELTVTESKLNKELNSSKELAHQKDMVIKELKQKLEETKQRNEKIESELRNELSNKTQVVDALQRENEQLHFTIEDDNSNHEIIVNEKDKMIERLEEHLKELTLSLESVRKDFESQTLLWEKSKIESQDTLDSKEEQLAALNAQICEMSKVLQQHEKTGKELEAQLKSIIEEKDEELIELKKQIEESNTALEQLRSEKQMLRDQMDTIFKESKVKDEQSETQMEHYVKQLAQYETQVAELQREVITLRGELESEKQVIVKEKEDLVNALKQEQITSKTLLTEKTSMEEKLAVEKQIMEVNANLIQQLDKEKSDKEHFEHLSTMLQESKAKLEDDLKSIQVCKASLEQKLNDVYMIKSNLEEERDFLLQEKNDFIERINQLNQQIAEESVAKDLMSQELSKLNKDLEVKESKNSLLVHNILELDTIQKLLVNDKELLNMEKEQLVQSLSIEKASRDEVECEKNAFSATLQQLNEKYASDMKKTQDQLFTVSTELKQVKTDFKKHEDTNVHIATILNTGLDKLLQNIQRNIHIQIGNEVLQKLIAVEDGKNVSLQDKCDLLINIAETLATELSLRKNLEKDLEHGNEIVNEMKAMITSKEMQVLELQTEVKKLQQGLYEKQIELSKHTETYNTTVDSKVKDIQKLQHENKSLNNELNDVKVQLEVKVHSLKEKLIDNENLTDKLKKTYECQIENLNVMITKLTSYLKEKTLELETVRKEKDKLQQNTDDNNKVIKMLEEELKSQKHSQEKLISDFESERDVLKNMVTVTESVMEDQRLSLSKTIAGYEKTIDNLQIEKKALEQQVEAVKKKTKEIVQEKQAAFDSLFKDLAEIRLEKELLEKEFESKRESYEKQIASTKDVLAEKVSSFELLEFQNKALKQEKDMYEKDMESRVEKLQREIDDLNEKVTGMDALEAANRELVNVVHKLKMDLLSLEEKDNELKIKKDSLESELLNRIDKLTKVLSDDHAKNDKFKSSLRERLQAKTAVQEKVKVLTDEIIDLVREKNAYISKLDEVKAECDMNEIKAKEDMEKLKQENERLIKLIEEHENVIANMEQLIQNELKQNHKANENNASERLNMENKCSLLQEYQIKAQKQLREQDREIAELRQQVKVANSHDEIENLKEIIADKDTLIAKIAKDKDEVIHTLSRELMNEKAAKEKYQKELVENATTVAALRQKLEEVRNEVDVLDVLKKENDEMIKVIGQRETFAAASHEKLSNHKLSSQTEKELRDRHQVSTPTSDLTHSSMESLKTITDLEKIIHDKNRTITTLQSDITYLKSLMAESENKLLDVTKELDIARENCEQLSGQLKKLVYQKNEEIADLKKQISKMSVTENRATQIIKVSAKYQAIILKRIAEIKSNTILKELTNFGNTASGDNDLKRSLTGGAVTMEDLENFLETTDRHLKRCTEKQLTLQKERDRLIEVNRINESEIINLKKFLTELSVSFKTFSSIKDIYCQKLSRVVSVQRTVRREILSLDGQITDAMMCKLERGYAAIMQDLAECSMNLERWVERCISRTISAEKIKQAFTSDTERTSLASTSFQNTSLEVQLDELDKSFQKLLEDVVKAQKGEGAKDPQAVTVMEVRAEYEDKLNRMKAKMKQLYQEQIQVFKDKQKEEIAILEKELQKTREKLSESSRAYEEHIKALTNELWNVGEKFLMKKDEAEWLRKQRSGSLMSLQHVHSSGLAPSHEEPPSRPSDTHSLRSLPVHNAGRDKRENRGLHMSDEEGEVFDNRWLQELATPRREGAGPGRPSAPGQRISELRWRNSLCPPHLKSSYPAETQFANTIDEDDIKCTGAPGTLGRNQRKEVGITAYKKPGPPTPSKQAGRLSATDSELRESLRPDPEAAVTRKTSTPSRLRALFRSGRSDTAEGTPRRKLSNIFRKK